MCAPSWTTNNYVVMISNIRSTVQSLEESLILSRNLEAEQCLRYAIAKSKNRAVTADLKRADQRNRNMLNLFRESVTDARLGIGTILPEPLNREVQRTWHEKYDALLAQNEQLKKEMSDAKLSLEKKDRTIGELQCKLLNLAESVNKQDLTIKKIMDKYSNLKKQKEQDTLLIQPRNISEGNSRTKQNKGKTSKVPIARHGYSDLEREVQCNIRLTFENARLRTLLREAAIVRK